MREWFDKTILKHNENLRLLIVPVDSGILASFDLYLLFPRGSITLVGTWNVLVTPAKF